MFGLNRNRSFSASRFALREHCAQSLQQGFPGNEYLRALHLVVRLRVITNVGNEDTSGFLNQQQTRAAGESAKVSNIWTMADEKSVKAGTRKMLPKLVLSSLKIHCCEFSKKYRALLYFIAALDV
jgi:hypothetical protein